MERGRSIAVPPASEPEDGISSSIILRSRQKGHVTFADNLRPAAAVAKTVGDRVEVAFDGMRCGSFAGVLKYVFYPGSALVQQVAVMSTQEPDTAYIYDAGIEMRAQADERVGGRMESAISFYDTQRRAEADHAGLCE